MRKASFFAVLILLGFALPGIAIGQGSGCAGDSSYLFLNQYTGSIQWEMSNDSISWTPLGGQTNDTLLATASAYYRAAITDGTCDPVYSDVTHLIISNMSVDAGADINSCPGTTVTLGGLPTASGGTPPYQYQWSPTSGLSSPTVANPTFTLAGGASFVVTVTDSLGCAMSDSITVDTTSGNYIPDTVSFAYTGAIDTFIVSPCVGTITIEVFGAQGGGGNSGGLGARMRGTFSVNPGDSMKILVGQQGLANYGYGGGGGSFVTTMLDSAVIIAGGGGGAEHNFNTSGYPGDTITSGKSILNASGGANGNGGQFGSPNTSGCGWPGGGGGGLFTDGDSTVNGSGYGFVNGGAGGTDPAGNCVVAGLGGFGGGGVGGNAGGGGGGYSGGAGGANVGLTPDRGGGGGGSINLGTNQSNSPGVQSGNGLIVIWW